MPGIITQAPRLINAGGGTWYNIRMKKLTATLFALGLLTTSVFAGASSYDETFATGKDWIQRMSKREKFISLVAPTLIFNRYDVHLRHSLPQYIYQIDRILLKNPQLEREDVNNIFASAIYLFEPENRELLKTMEMNFLRGDIEGGTYCPKLTIDEVLQEISPET